MPKLYSIDASFLAGEADPALVARVDDQIRANAAGKIRNMYVRSAGGVRTRPGMRLSQNIDGRQIGTIERTARVRLLQPGQQDRDPGLVDVTIPPPRGIPPFGPENAVVMEIWFRDGNGDPVTLPRGTTIVVRLRLAGEVSAGSVIRLYWWEYDPEREVFVPNTTDTNDDAYTVGPASDSATGGKWAVGRWRSGAGHDRTRDGWQDYLYIDQAIEQDFTHVLLGNASRIRIWRREWRRPSTDPATRPGLQQPDRNPYPLRVANWTGEYVRTEGAGAKPVSRLINATWFPGSELLLALHGSQATLLRGTDPDRLERNPFGFRIPDPPFTNDQVRTMQAAPSPDGVYLHSPGSGRAFGRGSLWPPRRLFFNADAGALVVEPAQIVPPGPIARSGQRIEAIGPFYPPSVVFPHQGRLIMAGTQLGPNAIWFSEQGNRNNFRQLPVTEARPLLASDPFMVEEVGRPNNHLLAVHGGLLLVFFGSRGISFLDRPYISATDFGFRENAERGIKAGVPPVEIGTGRLVFVDSSGQSVWLMTYANERQGYVLSELSQVAPHMLRDPEDCIFYTGLPDGGTAVLIVNEDGTIACCAVQPEGEWHAWSLWESDAILDVEPYAGGVWAMTRRGEEQKAVFIERFDSEVELDFCHLSPEGEHPFSAAYAHWCAVAEMRDGSRQHFGMRPRDEEETLAEVAARRLTAIEVFNGVPTKANLESDEGDFEPVDVVRWQVGQPIDWELQTLPFVKRTGEGSVFQARSKTQELFVNCVEGHLPLDPAQIADFYDRPDYDVPFTINDVQLPPTPRLFATLPPQPVGPNTYTLQHRFVNIVGWMDQNLITLKGHVPCTISSLSRTVVA